ncbi:MAG TPA: DUF222 domain-containing protein [Actinomycetota bacterium]|nr:DUF222 domain-containing protein [Actinomycetota bacterium]
MNRSRPNGSDAWPRSIGGAVFERDGHLSAASWLDARFGLGWGAARQAVHLARTLEQMPVVRRSLEDGEVPLSAVRTLAEAREADPEALARSESQLVEAARIHANGDLRKIVAYWRQAAEGDLAASTDGALLERRRLHASPTFGGMVRLDGDLDPETGESVLTALRAVLDAEARSGKTDDRTPAQRRADALGEVCRQWLNRSGRPSIAGERPHITVTVGAEVLAGAASLPGGPRGVSELDHVGPVPPQTARRFACDASVMRIVLGPRSEPLDVGRRTPVVPAIRRAVIVRDRSCRFPGCGRPHAWCDAHHVVHWAEGGATSIGNLVLLCRRHHRLVHEGRFSVEIVGARPVFRRADGSLLEARAPP